MSEISRCHFCGTPLATEPVNYRVVSSDKKIDQDYCCVDCLYEAIELGWLESQ